VLYVDGTKHEFKVVNADENVKKCAVKIDGTIALLKKDLATSAAGVKMRLDNVKDDSCWIRIFGANVRALQTSRPYVPPSVEPEECTISDLRSITLGPGDLRGFNYRERRGYEDLHDPGANHGFKKAIQSGAQVIWLDQPHKSIVIRMMRYESAEDAKHMFNLINTRHTRKVLFRDNRIGEDTFCHTSPDYYDRNNHYYHVCGFWDGNVYVDVQTTLGEDSEQKGVKTLERVYSRMKRACDYGEDGVVVPEVEEIPPAMVVPIEHYSECEGQGCLADHSCLSFGIRMMKDNTPSYCEIDGSFRAQKADGSACQNDYECLSNACGSGVCQNFEARLGSLEQEVRETKSIVSRILDWLRSIFR
jgi:hypothetical protein